MISRVTFCGQQFLQCQGDLMITAKCNSEVIYWYVRWWWIEGVNVLTAVKMAMFLKEEVSCSCLIGRFGYEPRDGICAQRMMHPGGQEWVRPKRRRYGDPVSSSTLWVKRQKEKQHLATPRQDRLYSALPMNWVKSVAENLWSLNNWVCWFLIDGKQWPYGLVWDGSTYVSEEHAASIFTVTFIDFYWN